MRILVVDDVAVVRLVIAKALRRAGHVVVEAGDGAEALQAAASHDPEVVVTDIWMPGSDGLDLIRTLESRMPHVAVVAMSGGDPHTTMVGTLAEAEAAGAVVSIQKPIDKDELLAAVDRAALKARRE